MRYFIIFLLLISMFGNSTYGKESNVKYSKENISNYLQGILSTKEANFKKAYKHLNKTEGLKNIHSNFNIEFIRTLVLLDKFEEAVKFSKNVLEENNFFYEADLILGLDYFIKKEYKKAEKHFERLEKKRTGDLLFKGFIENALLSWLAASTNDQKKITKYYNRIPSGFNNLKKLQNIFIQCNLNNPKTHLLFEKLIEDQENNLSRYNFFLINYLLWKNKSSAANEIINNARKLHGSNLLIKQSETFLKKNEIKKIKNLFNCTNPKDSIAEIFYIISNLYSVEKNYELSNFYLKISLLLNKKFKPNLSLLAENFFYEKRYDESKKIYNSLKSVGENYYWFSSLSTAIILSETEGNEYSTSYLKKQFDSIKKPDHQHFYELANFYKDNAYHSEAIEYYSLALNKLSDEHSLKPKILDRRGTSYERIGDWDKAEKDLKDSLNILPDQPFVLNYLAYSWIEKGKNIKEALTMLEKAVNIKKNNGYIIDSLGWAHYKNKNYLDAEKYLQRAVELLPLDPIINDHYADALWMLKKDIQARHFWKHVINLDETEEDLREKINKKIIFGIE